MSVIFDNNKKNNEKFDDYQLNEYLSDIKIVVELLKGRTLKRNGEKIQEHLSNIDKALSGIMDLLVGYVERTGKQEIFLTNDTTSDRKALVGSATKQALLKMGEPIYEKAVESLYHQYHCTLADCFEHPDHCTLTDCFEHPEYLNKILKEMFGVSYIVIVDSIKKQLEEFSYQKPIEQFLVVISK
ncbi:MAG: hypothetical protein E6K93_01325 [Thaumarchaeota archaeon]|nr:MAG: hypothetical protein E6K93_01325 [Nitrososphaerota archaeon]